MKPKHFNPVLALIVLTGFFVLSFMACSDEENDVPEVDLAWTEVGNTASLSGVDNDGDPYNISIEIVSSANGDSEAIFVDELEGDTSILEFKATDQGIYDYVLFEGDKSKPATLVEYEASIGTQWEYTLPSGTVVRRELVEKGNLFKVEQTYPNIPFAISIENIEWEITPQKGVVACTINYTDDDPIRLDID